MKNYKEVQMFAKNAPTGSYAAGCPDFYCYRDAELMHNSCARYCSQCERAFYLLLPTIDNGSGEHLKSSK